MQPGIAGPVEVFNRRLNPGYRSPPAPGPPHAAHGSTAEEIP